LDTQPEPAWRPKVGRALGLAIILGSVAVAAWATRVAYRWPRTDDAVVRANVVGIAPHVSGPIIDLPVSDNQEVKEGDLLFVIDPRPFELELERARAQLLLTRSEVEGLSKAVAAASAELKLREPEAAFAGDHVKRLEGLTADRYVTEDRFEEARVRASTSSAALEQARAQLARQKALLGQYGEVNAHLAVAESAVHAAELNLGYCQVRAPFPARVTNLNISRGEYARAGEQVFALVDTRSWYVIANFQETYLASIRPGMQADVSLIGYPGRHFRGTVEGISWAVRPADDQTVGVLSDVRPSLNWVRLSQRIPVRIRLEPPEPEHPYRMGMTAVITMLGDAAVVPPGKRTER
jgi:membrane fusion protein, multidrug efflux system